MKIVPEVKIRETQHTSALTTSNRVSKAFHPAVVTVIIALLCNNASVLAQTSVGGSITSSTTWMVAGSPYIVTATVTVQNNATLTIQAGVVVRFNSGTSLTVAAGPPGGYLVCQGTTSSPVIFTSYRDSNYGGSGGAQPGDWEGIIIKNSGNTLQNCVVYYAGQNNYPGIYIYQCSATIQNTRIAFCSADGVYATNMISGLLSNNIIHDFGANGIDLSASAPTIFGNVITNFGGTYSGTAYNNPAGIYVQAQSAPIIKNNTILGESGCVLYFSGSVIPTVSGNVFSAGYGFQVFGFDGAPPSTTLVNIQGLGWPYVFFNNLTVNSSVTLTVPAGTVLMGGSGASVMVNGILNVEGTPANPVVFTCYRDSEYYDGFDAGIVSPGEWAGISIQNGNNVLQNCVIRYAGNSTSGYGVQVNQCSPTIRNNLIDSCWYDGIYANGMSSGTITGNTISFCDYYGIELYGSSPAITANAITNNGDSGILVNNQSNPNVSGNLIMNNAGGSIANGIYVLNNSAPTITANTIISASAYALYFSSSGIPTISGNNISAGYGHQAFGFEGSPPSTTLVNIQGLGWPYVFFKNLTINAVLTVPAGTVVMGGSNAGITVNGLLDCEGTPATPVVFTSYRDRGYGSQNPQNTDASSGDWYGISLRNGNNVLQNCIIRCAGGTSSGYGVQAYQCSPTIRNNVIEACFYDGIYAYGMAAGGISNNLICFCEHEGIDVNDSSPSIMENTLSNNYVAGIYIYNLGNPIVNCNYIAGNGFGLDNVTGYIIDARSNWWGSATGPSGFGSGTGDVVSTNVNFAPWLSTPSWPVQIPTVTAPANINPMTIGFGLAFQGPVGLIYVVEASLDLKAWWPIWYFTSTNLLSYYTDLAATNYAARYYRVGILGPLGSNSPPTEITPPQYQTVPVGSNVTFNIGVSGTGPWSYQWQKNGAPLSDGSNVSGSKTATLSLAGVTATDVATYSVVMSNPVGPLLSHPATLSVLPVISSVTVIPQTTSALLAPGGNIEVIITGKGFGGTAAYDGDSNFLVVSNVTQGWEAGYQGDGVWANVTNWTDTNVVIHRFDGTYNALPRGLHFNAQDVVCFRVQNAQTQCGMSAPVTTQLSNAFLVIRMELPSTGSPLYETTPMIITDSEMAQNLTQLGNRLSSLGWLRPSSGLGVFSVSSEPVATADAKLDICIAELLMSAPDLANVTADLADFDEIGIWSVGEAVADQIGGNILTPTTPVDIALQNITGLIHVFDNVTYGLLTTEPVCLTIADTPTLVPQCDFALTACGQELRIVVSLASMPPSGSTIDLTNALRNFVYCYADNLHCGFGLPLQLACGTSAVSATETYFSQPAYINVLPAYPTITQAYVIDQTGEQVGGVTVGHR
jgi:parallel beta-helix repeat protein